MEFFATNGKRPVRLCKATREFAFQSQNHKYGKETMATPFVSLDHIVGYEEMTALEQYNCAISEIAQKAPLRICQGERISGAATLGDAILHRLPAEYKGRPRTYHSAVSHLTVDFETVLKKGVSFIKAQAEAAYLKHKGTEREPFSQSCLHCLGCMEQWHGRYLAALRELPEFAENYQNLLQVPFGPAKNFYQAVQSLWFTFAFLRLCGTWPGIGRIDWLLKAYLEQDLADGTLTLEEAREILAHFFIKGCEWIRGEPTRSGDAQHYQNLVLGGVDEDGCDVTNPVTYLVLDILEELGISDFPTTVRLSKTTDDVLVRRVAEVMRYGGGVLAVYNEDLILDSLTEYGYSLAEARKFANDGCWEIQIPGKTFFAYLPFDALRILQQNTLDNYNENLHFADFSSLYKAFIESLKTEVTNLMATSNHSRFIDTAVPARDWKWSPKMPCTVASLFEQGCIEKGLSYLEGGPIYNVVSPHIGGLPDAVNSLYAIKKLVFDEKKVTFGQLMGLLKGDWQDDEALRQYVAREYTYFGNDNDEVDEISKRIIEDFADICDGLRPLCGVDTPAGVSTFGRQIEWATQRLATPFGAKAGSVLSGNFSPTPGTDKQGATAIIRSYCKANLKRTVSGAALDIRLFPASVKGADGANVIAALLRGFVALGGHFMQVDIADTALLRQAQENPEAFQNLSVRVSGWSARFVTLSRPWQDMLIAQTEKDAPNA